VSLARQHPGGVLMEDGDRVIAFVNTSFCAMFGIPTAPEQMVGMDCPTLLSGAKEAFIDGADFLDRTSRAVEGRVPVYEELALKDGRIMGREYIPLTAPTPGHIWIYRDMTAHHDEKGVHLRQRVDEAESANRAKSSFLATMSHEIRTPLNAIVGMAELASRSALSPELRGYVSSIQASSEALLSLINDVLDFSKIEAGHLDIEAVPTDLVTICREVVEGQAVRAFSKGVEIWSRAAAGVPTRVIADPNRLRQVVMNLVGNAVKFTDQGSVIVRTDAGPIAGGKVPLHIQVSDTGTGIPDDQLDAIFERFSQASGDSKPRRRGGSGLGLTISRSLVEAMGGRLSVRSTLGQGSTFSIELALPVADGVALLPAHRDELAGHRIGLVGLESRPLQDHLVGMLSDLGASTMQVSGEDTVPAVDVFLASDDMAYPDQLLALGRPVIWLVAPGASAAGPGVTLSKPLDEGKLVRVLADALELDHLKRERAIRRARPCQRSAAILVVEDQKPNQAVAKKLLEDLGHQVDIAPDGERAVVAATHKPYDLIFMDIELGEVDGFEATRRIHEHQRARDEDPTAIVALTAHATEAIRQRAMAEGMAHFLTKPVDPKRLAAAVNTYADNRPKVLVVDDAPEHRTLMAHYLEGAGGYRVAFAVSGEDAIGKFAHQTFDCVLLDLQLPRMSGFDVLDAIGEHGDAGDCPVIAMTAESGAAARARCLDAGFNGFLSKPLRRAQLLEAIAIHVAPAGRARAKASRTAMAAARQTHSDTTMMEPAGVPDGGHQVMVPAGMGELVDEYLVILRDTFTRLREQVELEAFEAIRREAHNLKGSGGAYGFHGVTVMGAWLSQAARSEDTMAVLRVLGQLEHYLDNVVLNYEG